MSTPENPFAHEMLDAKQRPGTSALASVSANPKSLRWWPAAVLLVLMVAVRGVPSLMESVDMTVMMLQFFGPALISLLLLGWWMFASRAPRREKWTGLVSVIVLAVVSGYLLHFSMQGMTIPLYQLPVGIGSFALVVALLANRPANRLQTAMLVSAIGFGVWDLFLLEGVTGKFAAEFAWRWSPTAEDEYLRSLASRAAESGADPSELNESGASTEAVTRSGSPWSDFRGPLRDGKLPGIVLNEDWQSSPPKEIWKVKTGPGWSSITVFGNRLYTQEQRGDKEAVVCLNAETGRELWAHEYPGRFWEAIAGAGPRATPTICDSGLCSLGANGHLTCLDPVTGAVRWQRDIDKDADCKPPMWGFSASPLCHGGLVVVHAGDATAKGVVVAYDAMTGEPRWSVPSGSHSYSSPHIATFDGIEGILMATNTGLRFLNAQDGATIWDYEWSVENYRATQPLVSGDAVLVSTSLGLGTRRLAVKHEAESWSVTEDWTSLDMKPDFNDFVEYEGNVYGFDGNIFACMDLTSGKRRWKKGRYGNGQVLLLTDAGQLLLVSEQGDLVLLKADPAKLIEVARMPAIEGKTWNHPVLVGNRLYLRNGAESACFELAVSSAN